ncbi:hypothetical protein EJ04DRAFT_567779 [Polyplosphaeria fusca]|uniref:LPXTG-domain-containing protein n=1 Tax=Polyplosphaeria fusca TaxID=682080 RepID=A0A9P4QPM1_9PLEO|nr:hypothetical protein EJ04DRAFT_567779 [Polyplosphaeria fusca]
MARHSPLFSFVSSLLSSSSSACFLSLLLSLALFTFISAVDALEVTPDSPCSNFCIDRPGSNISDGIQSATFARDLVCLDTDLAGANSTTAGRKFRNCIGCQQSSDAVSAETENENDVYWFLFNIKSSFVWCVAAVFADRPNPSPPPFQHECNTQCSAIRAPLLDRLLETNQTLQYAYCDFDGGAFAANVAPCTQCLRTQENAQVQANYLDALVKACEQRPRLGEKIELGGDVFITASVAASSSMTTASASSTATAAAAAATASSTEPRLNKAAIAGICAGAVAGLGLLVGLVWVHLRKRKEVRTQRDMLGYGHGDVKEIYSREVKGGMYVISRPVELSGDHGRGAAELVGEGEGKFGGGVVELDAWREAGKGPRVKVG